MSNIVHVRIDDRFIHGQVANVWSASLGIERIIVANDSVALNEVQKSALRMSTPKGINTSLIEVEKASHNLVTNKYGNQKILIIVNCPQDVERLIANGVNLETINIGNMSKRDNTTQIAKSVSITVEEKECISRLISNQVKVTLQMLPDAKVVMAEELI